MSALGQYVHLSWTGYETAGTFRNQSSWTRVDQKVRDRKEYNYEGAAIFERFKEQVQKRANLIQSYDIATLEKQYNKLRMDQFDAFKRLQNQKSPEFLQLLEKVVINANLGRNIKVKELAKVLVLDDTTQNITTAQLEALGEDVKVIRIKQLAKAVKGTETTFLETIRLRCADARALVDNSPSKAILDPDLTKIENEIAWVEKQTKNNRQKYNYLMKFTRIQDKHSAKEYKTVVPREWARMIVSQLLSIAKAADISSALGKLQGSFTEIMGTSLRPMLHRLAVREIEQVAQGLKTSRPSISNKPMVDIYIDQVLMEEKFKNQKATSERFEVYTSDNGVVTFKTDYETQDKKDFILEWQGSELAVSAKAYDLSVVDFYDKNLKQRIPNFISLQTGTSLLIYLLNIQQNSQESSLGTHFLNVFAKHDKTTLTNNYTQVRRSAEDALLVFLLYNALTGDMSGKASTTFANILMIEDKSKSLAPNIFKVRFYNIATIINTLFEHQQNLNDFVYISPSLSSLSLNNTLAETPLQRITQLLMHTRATKMSVGLYINKLPDFREF